MIYNAEEASKFLSKLCADSSAFRVYITPEGLLNYEGVKKIKITDYIAVHNGKLWGRAGVQWISTDSLPEKSVPICAFSLKRLAIFNQDGTVECTSHKKALDSQTAFLLCTKFPAGIRLIIADPTVGKQHITLTLCRDADGEAFCRALIRQFVQHRLPDQMDALSVLLNGGDAE